MFYLQIIRNLGGGLLNMPLNMPLDQGYRLLCVDGDPHNSLLLRKFLTGCLGHTVWSVSTGLHLNKTLKAFEPNLILVGLQTPHYSGLKVLDQLQKSQWSSIPVIAMSADMLQLETAFELGAAHYLLKPINLEKLGNLVRACVHDPLDVQTSGPSITSEPFYGDLSHGPKPRAKKTLTANSNQSAMGIVTY